MRIATSPQFDEVVEHLRPRLDQAKHQLPSQPGSWTLKGGTDSAATSASGNHVQKHAVCLRGCHTTPSALWSEKCAAGHTSKNNSGGASPPCPTTEEGWKKV
uniref:Uncharacterized protein n=1 Tax=Laticauda laticaudata TaxID=8630 RepID=A0A8C5SG37_LATLA